ncbi:aryl-alcohol dehydrogenase-like predicted oxidoreductase [Kitasatospora sp. SolWspMP-SS2h]|uniref:oxidoreductase n=1 Tax=Kitasatospora sp. SolWspMP-SS2h TaxID=1305729 RepID=UPI000DB9A11F|nr:oxidoreductase [Kitasatospora sp. SolWspMP-SS2h]RAJ46831.1 aryl-alcohol dehydrogenase-like predicted oxidoreductase [Kitasatospora sp. SolWspMP-SS2h]
MTPTPRTITAAAAGSWTLGDRVVHRIGFGAMRLAQTGAALVPGAVARDRGQAVGVLRRAVELGVNHLDTAAFYFSPLRSANELINRALSPYPDDLVIATKVGQPRDPSGAWLPHARPDQLRGLVEENLRQLGRDHLDLVNLRVVGDGSVAERFGALAELRTAGLVRHLGLSNVQPHQLAEAQGVAPVVCVQNMYGLGVRPEQDALVELCREQGVAFVPFYAIAAAGRQYGAGAEEHPEVVEVARAHGASPAQVRIAWTLHRGPHVLAIPGTGDPAHLEANVAAGGLRLSAAELAQLDALHRR